MSTRLRPLRMRHVVWGGVLGGGASALVVALIAMGGPGALVTYFAGDPADRSYAVSSAAFFFGCFMMAGIIVGAASALLSWGAACLVTPGRPESRGRAVVTVTVASVLGGALSGWLGWSLQLAPPLGAAVACTVVGVVGGAAAACWAVWMSQGKPATTPQTSTTGDGAAPAA
ncbi:putative membrane-bound spermidine synthase [Frigoribacterium sp. PvP120]|uniref:hypothetical protein n=1 Tax=unclassified Frigoribacterium TaxID=2627005 RepID=UPI001AE1A5F8|nr:hypothetical protein [Frigoribacterium sp. PvP121]MBP1242129.1 putative membrane-bound spermidine synthase [Frigoribacterium sp. PvP121]